MSTFSVFSVASCQKRIFSFSKLALRQRRTFATLNRAGAIRQPQRSQQRPYQQRQQSLHPQRRWHGGDARDPTKKLVKMTFITPEGKRIDVEEPEGTNVLIAAHRNNVDLEGACECSLACSTCHVIVKDQDIFDSLPEPSDEEEDMLDLAFGLTETSRLGCQVLLTPAIDGMEVELPSATRNMAVDGFKPKPH